MPMTEIDTNEHSLAGLGIENQRFTSKSEIKPWLQKYLLLKRGINIVIERSDSTKIIFKCKSNKSDVGKVKVTVSSRKQNTCPFKIRANYSLRNSLWTLVIINDTHNHKLDDGYSDRINIIRKNSMMLSEDNDIDDTNGMKNTSDDFGTLTDLTSQVELSNAVQYQVEIEKEVFDKSNKAKRKRKKRMKESSSRVDQTYDHTIQFLKQEVHSLIDRNITKNKFYSENDKTILLKMFVSSFLHEYKNQTLGKDQTQAQTQSKSGLNTWLTSPNTPGYAQLNISTGSNTNLIPLSPLLNDVEAEYQDSNTASVHQSMDSFTHLPGINMNSTIQQSAILTSSQMSQIQNQGQQLPSFNFIQNQLPASPNGMSATTSLFGNNNLGSSSLIPPINNSNSMTLNPSHLLKSSTKNNVLNFNQSTSLLDEFKINNSSTTTSIANNNAINLQAVNSNHNFSITNAGLSTPNNNIINHASSTFSNMGINYNKEGNSTISTQENNTTIGGLHGIGSLGDTYSA